MKKKKGFTLIELLVVMVILAIIALITVPNALSMIETAQERSFRSSTQGLIKASENLYVLDKTGNGNVPVFILFDNYTKTVYPSGKDISYNGTTPKSGGIHMFEDGSIKLALYDGTHCSVKNRTSEDITISKISESACVSNIYYSQVSAPFNNLIINGDFSSNSFDGWYNQTPLNGYNIISFENEILNLKYVSGQASYWIGQQNRLNSGDRYYISSKVRSNYNRTGLQNLRVSDTGTNGVWTTTAIVLGDLVKDQWVIRDGIGIINATNLMIGSYSHSAPSDLNYEIDYVTVINITNLFAESSSITVEYMREVINRVWINGSDVRYFSAGGWKTF
jgi:prepilin-type N-terminal cleavage/methylation domain-containing protein